MTSGSSSSAWKNSIVVLLVCLFLIHLPGLYHGLPFWLVNDELPLIGGALRMMELRNPIPSMNPLPMEIRYYSPGMPWVYLVVWAPVLAFQWIPAGFPALAAFIDTLLANLKPIWIVSRAISVLTLVGTAWVLGQEKF